MASVYSSEQTVKKWGNGLGISISAAAARAAHLTPGMQVSLEISDDGALTVRSKAKLSLAQKLKLYDPVVHGGEVSTGGLVGKEKF